MVVGNGLIGRAFSHYAGSDSVVIFASGVSNSKAFDQAGYERERNLLVSHLEQLGERLIVYFSSCSVENPELNTDPYHQHKRAMEQLIQNSASSYLVCRLPNLVGRSENHATVLNYLVEHCVDGTHIDLWSKATRNFIDVDDAQRIISCLIQDDSLRNKVVNVASSRNTPVVELVRLIESTLGCTAKYTVLDKGVDLHIDIAVIKPIVERLGVDFANGYVEGLLKKYYLGGAG